MLDLDSKIVPLFCYDHVLNTAWSVFFFKVEARELEMLLEFLPLLKSGQSCDSNLPIKTTRSSREYERIVVVEH